MSLTEEIKSYALDLGYSQVGITTAEPFPMYAQALEERSQDYDWAGGSGLRLERTVNPKDRLPDARSIRCVGWGSPPDTILGHLGSWTNNHLHIGILLKQWAKIKIVLTA